MSCMQAFKSYDEAGAGRRIQCLKYLVLATMLMESAVDPFDAQEAAPYKQDPEVLAMTNLVAAYQENNIKGFERILKTNKCAPPEKGSAIGQACHRLQVSRNHAPEPSCAAVSRRQHVLCCPWPCWSRPFTSPQRLQSQCLAAAPAGGRSMMILSSATTSKTS